jgi:hypothetical protein
MTTSRKKYEPTETCPTNYDPHLCYLTVGEETVGAYESNKCFAIQKLEEYLYKKHMDPKSAAKLATCGRVHQ